MPTFNLSEYFIKIILQATTVFHTFHTGSKEAYQWLTELKKECPTQEPEIPDIKVTIISKNLLFILKRDF